MPSKKKRSATKKVGKQPVVEKGTGEESSDQESDQPVEEVPTVAVEDLLRAIQLGMRTSTDQTFGRFGRLLSGTETGLQLDGFIEAIKSYKDQQGIADEDALRQLSQVLEGTALTWWMTTGRASSTWSDALLALKETFGIIERDVVLLERLLETKQTPEQTVPAYIATMLAINGQRKRPVEEIVFIELVFLGLRPTIQNRLKLEDIGTVSDLRTRAALAEADLAYAQRSRLQEERNRPSSKLGSGSTSKGLLNPTDVTPLTTERPSRKETRREEARSYGKPPRMDRTKTAQRSTRVLDQPLRCTNCSSLGWSTGSCGRFGPCSGKDRVDQLTSEKSTSAKNRPTNRISTRPPDRPSEIDRDRPGNRPRPYCDISIFGRPVRAVIDTGADVCVGGTEVFDLCMKNVQGLKEVELPRMADGRPTSMLTYTTMLDVECHGRTARVEVMIQPKKEIGPFLLGYNYLRQVGLTLSPREGSWSFEDDPQHKYSTASTPLGKFPRSYRQDPKVGEEVRPQTPREKLDVFKEHLTPAQQKRVTELLDRFHDRFEPTREPVKGYRFEIDTGAAKPIRVSPYRVSPKKKAEMKTAIGEMLREGVIEESRSPWSSPLLMVPKPGGGWRPCVDYRRLNEVTKSDVFPLPRMDDILILRERFPYISTLDQKNGYWQVEMEPASREKTAFSTPDGLYQFIRMPFGVKNGPAVYQRMMNEVLAGLVDVCCLVYLDDIIVLSKTFESHLQDLYQVFTRLRQAGLSLNPSKCHILAREVKFLGHVVTPDGVRVDPEKVNAVKTLPAPKTVPELQTFLGMVGWYRRYIPEFARIGRPLFDLLKKQKTWTWTREAQESFDRFKHLLTEAPVLQGLIDDHPVLVRTDASGEAVGAVLVQLIGDQEHVVEYASRTFTPAERNYSTIERECLAVVWALDKFRPYVEGQPITLETDHQPLRWLMTLKNPSARLTRWIIRLQEHQLTIKYRPGRENKVADYLSRRVVDRVQLQISENDSTTRPQSEVDASPFPVNPEEI